MLRLGTRPVTRIGARGAARQWPLRGPRIHHPLDAAEGSIHSARVRCSAELGTGRTTYQSVQSRAERPSSSPKQAETSLAKARAPVQFLAFCIENSLLARQLAPTGRLGTGSASIKSGTSILAPIAHQAARICSMLLPYMHYSEIHRRPCITDIGLPTIARSCGGELANRLHQFDAQRHSRRRHGRHRDHRHGASKCATGIGDPRLRGCSASQAQAGRSSAPPGPAVVFASALRLVNRMAGPRAN